MLFGKNSDRQRNEAQVVEQHARAEHAPGSVVRCTYLTIPQEPRTHAVMICRPYWMWGAEMGANEQGVVIGNEGLQARSPAPRTPALTGMDLLRLALERAASAVEAVRIITTLLSQHGQGGNGGHLTSAYYNNGFLIADASEAFVLETVEREWVLERVRDVRAMSNKYSIGKEPDRCSTGILEMIRTAGWADEGATFGEMLADPNREHIGNAGARRSCSTTLLLLKAGHLTARDMFLILRDHGSGERFHPEWSNEVDHRYTLCMHATTIDRPGQTVGSMVSDLREKSAVHWVTGTAAPCISIFKPVLLDVPLPAHGPAPTDAYSPGALWWRHERLHRTRLLDDFAGFLETIRPERDALEQSFQARMDAVLNGGTYRERAHAIDACWSEAMQAEDRWYAQLCYSRAPAPDNACAQGWRQMNRLAGFDPEGVDQS